eukprot:TRINITY_DN61102_c0_g2_i1.p1 TRINITY_DN61102_c0_g2~~TRINITY_DN61102_c0_g2_i1.p1  ORF type:complete len:696 (-),score=95.50 TRINITY_DN61102_c0_g2_i1:44-2080(-)
MEAELIKAAEADDTEKIQQLLDLTPTQTPTGDAYSRCMLGVWFAARKGNLNTTKTLFLWVQQHCLSLLTFQDVRLTVLLSVVGNNQELIDWLLDEQKVLELKPEPGARGLDNQLKVVKQMLAADGVEPPRLFAATCTPLQMAWESLMWAVEEEEEDDPLGLPAYATLVAAATGNNTLCKRLTAMSTCTEEWALFVAGTAAVRSNIELLQHITEKYEVNIATAEVDGEPLAVVTAGSESGLEALKWIDEQLVDCKLAEIENSWGNTALHVAAGKGHLHTVEWLVEVKGMNPHECCGDGNITPFLTACYEGQFAIAKWLRSHGSELTEESDGGMNCLDRAILADSVPIVEWLVEHEKLEATADHVTNAIEYNSRAVFKWLVDEKQVEFDKGAALFRACGRHQLALYGNNWLEVVNHLIKNHGVDPNELWRDEFERHTPLLTAASSHRWDLVKWLLTDGGVRVGTGCEPLGDFLGTIALWQSTQPEFLEWVLKNTNVSASTCPNGTPRPQWWFFRRGGGTLKVFVEAGGIQVKEEDLAGLLRTAVELAYYDLPYCLMDLWWSTQAEKRKNDPNFWLDTTQWCYSLEVPLDKRWFFAQVGVSNVLQKQGWWDCPHNEFATEWSVKVHKEFPLVFQLVCQLAFFCLVVRGDQSTILPGELGGAVAQFWVREAFCPRLQYAFHR